MKRLLSILCVCTLALCSNAGYSQQKQWNTEVPKQIIILSSTKNYNEALATAKEAAKKLGKELNLRGHSPNPKTGLSLSKEDCAGSGGSDERDYPCYEARGDGNAENDDYISIEYSSWYKGFAKDLYIVVAGVTDEKGAAAEKALAAVKKVYSGAYGKRTMIWYGPMN